MGEIPKSTFDKSYFFSDQRFSVQNLRCTKSVKVLKAGINIFTRKVWVGKILHNIRLKIQCRWSAIPKAWELKKVKINTSNPGPFPMRPGPHELLKTRPLPYLRQRTFKMCFSFYFGSNQQGMSWEKKMQNCRKIKKFGEMLVCDWLKSMVRRGWLQGQLVDIFNKNKTKNSLWYFFG